MSQVKMRNMNILDLNKQNLTYDTKRKRKDLISNISKYKKYIKPLVSAKHSQLPNKMVNRGSRTAKRSFIVNNINKFKCMSHSSFNHSTSFNKTSGKQSQK